MKTLLLALIMACPLHAEVMESKDARWAKLMGLVGQEMRILEAAKKKGVEIKYRMLELHSERLKLIHEKNNREFLAGSKASGSGKDKEKYFIETRAYYQTTKDFGQKILREEARNSRKAEILYALALNSRDYGRDNVTEKYLLEVIGLVADPRNSLRHHAQTALADFYYNDKRFPEAITYYQRVIQNEEDDWKTKHLFNLSWCYLKNREFDRAIDTIKSSYFESKNPAYVNIRDQVLENIGSFYVYAGRPLDGLSFYLENEKNPLPYLMPMALKASDKGHEKETREILDAAQKVIDRSALHQHQEELFHTYLDFYRHYNRFTDHEKTSRALVAYYQKAREAATADKKTPLKQELRDDAIEKMRSLAGFLQVKLAKDVRKDAANYSTGELEIVLSYFSHLVMLDEVRKAEYLYFRAETYFSVNSHQLAADSYVESVGEARKAKNLDLARKSLNSLLALTGQEELPKAQNKKYLIFAYSGHVDLWPRDEKSEQIYPKLFEIYREAFDDGAATALIAQYHKAYPEHLSEQQTFMTKILDQFIERKNTLKLNHWIGEFKKGFLSFPRESVEKTEIVLGNLLFMEYQELAKKGERLAAAKGFEGLYVHKLYPDKVKYQAAFFAAMAYLELGETEKSFYWQELAHARMTEEQKLERREEQLRMAERTYRLQDFPTAYKIAELLLSKWCDRRDEVQNRFFEIAVMTALVDERHNDAERVVVQHSRCLIRPETRDSSLAQIYQALENKGDFFKLRSFVQRHQIEPYVTQYRYTLQKWYWEKNDVNLKTHIRAEFRDLKHSETLAWLAEINLYKEAEKDFADLKASVVWQRPQFDGDLFNQALETYLLKLKAFKERYQSLSQSSQVDLAIVTTRLFSQVYRHVGETVQAQRPLGMDGETLVQFSAAMKNLSQQFLTVSLQYEKTLNTALLEKETLSWGARSIASVEAIENPVFSFFTGLPMDKSKD